MAKTIRLIVLFKMLPPEETTNKIYINTTAYSTIIAIFEFQSEQHDCLCLCLSLSLSLYVFVPFLFE